MVTGLETALAALSFPLLLTLPALLDSLLHHLRPGEVALTAGACVALHLPLALALMGVSLVIASAFGPKIQDSWSSFLVSWIFLFAAWLGLVPLLGDIAPGSLSGAVLCLVIAAWLALRHPHAARQARSAGMALGLAVLPLGVVAVVDGALASRPAPLPLPATGAKGSRPDILLISTDALSAMHLGSHGYPRHTSPVFDRLAERSLHFTQAYAVASFTAPALASLMTGQDPLGHKVWHLKARLSNEAADQSMPATLRRAGYRTLAVSTNPFGGPHKLGLSRHFDVVLSDQMALPVGCLDRLSAWLRFSCPASDLGFTPLAFALAGKLVKATAVPGHHYDPARALAAAERLLIHRVDGPPLFLWVHLMPPHDPYVASSPFVGMFDPSPDMRTISGSELTHPHFCFAKLAPEKQALFQARYDEGIRAVDYAIGRFLVSLQNTGRLRSTLLVLTADHGESFASDYGGHGGPRLDPAVIRIPLLFHGDMVVPAKVETPVSQVDIAPTILALAGVSIPRSMSGTVLTDTGARRARPVFAFWLEPARVRDGPSDGTASVINWPWHYTVYLGQTATDPRLTKSLKYLHAAGPDRKNMISSRPDIVKRLEETLKTKLKQGTR
ncbi:sulfatase [Thermaurantiacus sp.]